MVNRDTLRVGDFVKVIHANCAWHGFMGVIHDLSRTYIVLRVKHCPCGAWISDVVDDGYLVTATDDAIVLTSPHEYEQWLIEYELTH